MTEEQYMQQMTDRPEIWVENDLENNLHFICDFWQQFHMMIGKNDYMWEQFEIMVAKMIHDMKLLNVQTSDQDVKFRLEKLKAHGFDAEAVLKKHYQIKDHNFF